MAFDRRTAWVGTFADDRSEKVRVEAAAWEGRPVYFQIGGDWQQQGTSAPALVYRFSVVFVFGITLLLAGAFLARQNVKSGRSDRAGAARLATFGFIATLTSWVLLAAHVAGIFEINLFVRALCIAAFMTGVLWVGYLSVEPYARRYWPDALISWTRLQTGRLRDSLVASHVLAGVLTEAALVVFCDALMWAFGSGRPIFLPRIDGLNGPAYAAGLLFHDLVRAFGVGLAILVVVVLLRLLVRRMWLADALAAIVLGGVLSGLGNWVYQNTTVYTAFAILNAFAFLVLLRRFGLLAIWAALATTFALFSPVSVASWYAGRALVVLAIPAAAGAWALWVILSAQRQPSTESAG